MATVKIRIIKRHRYIQGGLVKARAVGTIMEVAKDTANAMIDEGLAEYVDPPKKPKKKKEQKIDPEAEDKDGKPDDETTK